MTARMLASDVIKGGSILCDMLVEERAIKDGGFTMTSMHVDVDEVEAFLKNGIILMHENILALEKELMKAQAEEKSLHYALDKRKSELERSKERLATLMNLRPAYMDEFEVLKKELQELFPEYVERFRNLEWLEAQLEGFHLAEQKKHEEVQRKMKSLQRRYQEEEIKFLQGVDITSLSIDDNDQVGSETTDYDQVTTEGDIYLRAPQRASSISVDLGNVKTEIAALDTCSSGTPSLELDDGDDDDDASDNCF